MARKLIFIRRVVKRITGSIGISVVSEGETPYVRMVVTSNDNSSYGVFFSLFFQCERAVSLGLAGPTRRITIRLLRVDGAPSSVPPKGVVYTMPPLSWVPTHSHVYGVHVCIAYVVGVGVMRGCGVAPPSARPHHSHPTIPKH